MKDLTGKVALITGSAGGIGLGIARACAAAGMKVAISDIDEVELEHAAAELRTMSSAVLPVRLDVTDRDGWARAAEEVPAALGPVQLLVNNAGVSTYGIPFDDIDPALWDRVLSINLTGVFNGVHYFLGAMRAAGGGHIVNTSSAGGLLGIPRLAPYCAAKFAIVGLSESLRAELAGTGVGVSVLCPGSVRSRIRLTSRAIGGLTDAEIPSADVSGQQGGPGMEPDEVGRRVLAAVAADELYIMTHPEMRGAVGARHEQMMRSFDVAEAFPG